MTDFGVNIWNSFTKLTTCLQKVKHASLLYLWSNFDKSGSHKCTNSLHYDFKKIRIAIRQLESEREEALIFIKI